MKIQYTKKVKSERLEYPSRQDRATGRTHRDVVSYDARAKGMSPEQRIVVLNLGQLGTLVRSLDLTLTAMKLHSIGSAYDENYTTALRESLNALGAASYLEDQIAKESIEARIAKARKQP